MSHYDELRNHIASMGSLIRGLPRGHINMAGEQLTSALAAVNSGNPDPKRVGSKLSEVADMISEHHGTDHPDSTRAASIVNAIQGLS